MSENKIIIMKELYANFPEELKKVLSNDRIYKFSECSEISKANRKLMMKDYQQNKKQVKDLIKTEITKLKKNEKKVVKNIPKNFKYDADVLAYDISQCELLIKEYKNQIKTKGLFRD